MLFTQATLAAFLAAGVSAVPMANNGGSAPSSSTCNGGNAQNWCMQEGLFTQKQKQDCDAEGGSSYCCESGNGLNILSCANLLNDASVSIKKRNDQGSSSSTCNGGSASNWCMQKGLFTKKQSQDCDAEGGSSYCCSSGDGVNALSCSSILNDASLDVLGGGLGRRTNSAQPGSSSSTCNGGSAQNVCLQGGKFTKKQSQSCHAAGGSSYCCSSGSGVNLLSCSNIANGLTINVGLARMLEELSR